MSPRLTCLMQDWGIERSAPLKCLVGVRREAAGLLKIADDIDIKTQHIEWCQLKFHRVPFGKLGSWACQCEMNNETRPALLIFYLMWNSSLLGLRGSGVVGGWGCTSYRCAVKRKESSSCFIYAWNRGWRLNDYEESFVFTAGSHCYWSPHDECLKTHSQWVWAEFIDSDTLGAQVNHSTELTHSPRVVCGFSPIPVHIRNCSHVLSIGIWSVTPQLPSNCCV